MVMEKLLVVVLVVVVRVGQGGVDGRDGVTKECVDPRVSWSNRDKLFIWIRLSLRHIFTDELTRGSYFTASKSHGSRESILH